MEQKTFTLYNKGMNRDLSVSKTGESSAYENHNIRILEREHETSLSVTNERGNKKIVFGSDVPVQGTLIGWNVLNNHIILFTHENPNVDRIYRIDYISDENEFYMVRGTFDADPNKRDSSKYQLNIPVFSDDLGFSINNPIESVVYYETEEIQKIYWVDGKNVLRLMNFVADLNEINSWTDNTVFDSNRAIKLGVEVSISKDNSGNTRANGVAQYFLTYYNKHAQESGYAWISDLVYLSPIGHGGAADGYNNNKITLKITGLDTRFSNFRIYSIVRTALNGETTGYIVADGSTAGGEATIIDDGHHLVAEDASRLLFLGSRNVCAGTLAHKDQTLFLGDLKSVGRDFVGVEEAIRKYMFTSQFSEGNTWEAKYVTFDYSDSSESKIIADIPYNDTAAEYSYDNQLTLTSSAITTFKGMEKYRFAIVFRDANGVSTDAFWIGDKVNRLYPVMDVNDHVIKRIIAKCTLHPNVVSAAQRAGYVTAQLMIAEATYSDRSVKAQGILNPTVFNVWDRFNDRLYASASWISRPRNSGFAFRHFEPIHNSTSSTGEIECNYWKSSVAPTPYYTLDFVADPVNPTIMDELEGMPDYDYLMVLYKATCETHLIGQDSMSNNFFAGAAVIYGRLIERTTEAAHALSQYQFPLGEIHSKEEGVYYPICDGKAELKIMRSDTFEGDGNNNKSRRSAYNKLFAYLHDELQLPDDVIVGFDTLNDWFEYEAEQTNPWNKTKHTSCYNILIDNERYDPVDNTMATDVYYSVANRYGHVSGEDSLIARWYNVSGGELFSSADRSTSFYKKHLTFVDENVVTLNSPELEYNAFAFDNVDGAKLRIVGVAKMSGVRGDYTVIADHGKLAGENLLALSFSGKEGSGNLDGLISWPLWKDNGLKPKSTDDDTDEKTLDQMTSSDYEWGSSIVNYWLHMWNRQGKINYFTDENGSEFSLLRRKTFANVRYASTTIYNTMPGANQSYEHEYDVDVRIFNYLSSQYVGIDVNDKTKAYDGFIRTSIGVPGNFKYPVLYSRNIPETDSEVKSTDAYLYSGDPIQIEYASNPHLVLAMKSYYENDDDVVTYKQRILPWCYDSDHIGAETSMLGTKRVIPWIDNLDENNQHIEFAFDQEKFDMNQDSRADSLSSDHPDRYLFIGEVYQDYDSDPTNDPRYGGISLSAVQNNRFIPAGPWADISEATGAVTVYGNQSDTYFQRWDCMKTKPASTDDVNSIIDITSFMVETHINIDGITDTTRGTRYPASLDTANYGQLNHVYTQPDNYVVSRDMDEDFDLDTYRSSITWTLEKTDSAQIDEWSHITLASTLKLDGDKGICRALRRFQNSIIAFQDRSISEILFNSRTQLTTTDGVPVEIANSGKVDGKRYITNKYGCLNKWSIVEGKAALYFVDNINKAFCSFSGDGVQSLSARCGLTTWFRNTNDVNPWSPERFNNVVGFYDRVHSDVYLVSNVYDDDSPCVVYNEALGVFTSFFDYGAVPMMTNVDDRFVSFRGRHLWRQNEGLYCNFFGIQYNYWTQYRITPDPFGDKIWTNVDYRADFYEILDDNGDMIIPEISMIQENDVEAEELYRANETFDTLKIWNEYQQTKDLDLHKDSSVTDPARKKFRIWRVTIPRAIKEGKNKFSLDRIRNPWINLKLTKKLVGHEDENNRLVQLNDITVRYFE